MGKLIKFLIYLAIIGFIGLAVYAYVGPFFGRTLHHPRSKSANP